MLGRRIEELWIEIFEAAPALFSFQLYDVILQDNSLFDAGNKSATNRYPAS